MLDLYKYIGSLCKKLIEDIMELKISFIRFKCDGWAHGNS